MWKLIPFGLEIFFTAIFMFICNGIVNLCFGNLHDIFWTHYWSWQIWSITSVITLFLWIIYIRLKQVFKWNYH